jgi:hypothetical protein
VPEKVANQDKHVASSSITFSQAVQATLHPEKKKTGNIHIIITGIQASTTATESRKSCRRWLTWSHRR